MEINDKKFTRTRKVVNFLIAVVLAAFLILLSNTIIGDLDSTVSYPYRNSLRDTTKDNEYREQTGALEKQIANFSESRANIRKMIEVATTNKEAEQESFDNWITTRSTLGKIDQDPEVLKRLTKLDEYKDIVQSWQSQSDSIYNLTKPLYAKINSIDELKNVENQRVDELYYSAMNGYEIKVFLIRLLFVAPILLLGIYFFLRKRKHKFSPLFMGFSLFSLYAFFVGLVPYLPSYGGYIRYTVGILLTLGLGYYAIKRLRIYQERKIAELQSSSAERASKLDIETAEKAFKNHVCPSCGKDFLLKNWEGLKAIDKDTVRPTFASHYCRHCGMQLVKKCDKCGQENYAHLPFCIACGDALTMAEK